MRKTSNSNCGLLCMLCGLLAVLICCFLFWGSSHDFSFSHRSETHVNGTDSCYALSISDSLNESIDSSSLSLSSDSSTQSTGHKSILVEKLKRYEESLKNNASKKPEYPYGRIMLSNDPDDAYGKGYDAGYEQGLEDGRNGYRHGYNYDDSSDYYDYYETKYQEGYEEGYEEGYYEGLSQYEEEQEEEDW